MSNRRPAPPCGTIARVSDSRPAIVDGDETPVAEVRGLADDVGFTRGYGVFEVIRLYDGHPFMAEEHLERLARSAARMLIAYDAAALRAEMEQLVEACDPDGVIRIVVTGSGTRLLYELTPPTFPPSLSLLALHHRVSPLMAGVKSLSYGAHMVAHELAQQAGCDTALFVDDVSGRVLEAPIMSFVLLRDGELITPPLSDGILDGITRRVLLETSVCKEEATYLADLELCDGAAVLSTNAEMRPVHAIRGLVETEIPVEPILPFCRQLSAAIAQRASEGHRRAGADRADTSSAAVGTRSHQVAAAE